jgi:hypothetical protein
MEKRQILICTHGLVFLRGNWRLGIISNVLTKNTSMSITKRAHQWPCMSTEGKQRKKVMG